MWGLASHERGGFLVNRLLETSDPRVYAIGECAALGDMPVGTVSPGYAMAECLAHTLLGRAEPFQALPPCVRLKIAELPVAVAGTMSGGSTIVAASSPGVHRSIQVEEGRLVGAQGVGDWFEWERVEDAVRRRGPIADWQIERFREGDTLWPDEPASVGRRAELIVCSCNRVTCGAVETAVRDGCRTLAAVSARTGAARTCGACAPAVERIIDVRRPAPRRWGMAVVGALTLPAVGLVAAGRPLLARWRPDRLPLFDHLWRRPDQQRLTGWVLLGLIGLALLLPLMRRRGPGLRVLHALAGGLLVMGLVAHTGLRLGVNFNWVVSMAFLGLAGLGGLAALGGFCRRWTRFLHEALFWPALALLALHVVAIYYF
jgi:nitrite reductase (NADH) large subunit